MCVALHRDYHLPENYPVAVFPMTSKICGDSIVDRDSTYLMPSLDDIKENLDPQHREMAEIVAMTLFMSLQLSTNGFGNRGNRWFDLVLSPRGPSSSTDDELFNEELTH
jgi:hypothetical protein